MKITSHIRFAKRDDMGSIIELCVLHALYEKVDYAVEGKASQLAKDLFIGHPKLFCLVVECNNELIGYATYMKQYATWDTSEYIYMDCIYLKEFARGLGIGQKLVDRVKLEGRLLGCLVIQWQTPTFNTRAIKFYKRLGATSNTKERFFLKI